MIGKRTISICLVFLLGIYGCGAGNAKTHLTFEEVSQLQQAPNVYVVHYPTPDFSWWFHNAGYPFFSGYRKYSLIEAKKRLNIPFSIRLDDPTLTLKHKLSGFAKDQIGLRNIKHISDSSLDDNPMNLRQKLGPGKVIDLKTNFWQLYPTYSRQSLDPEEASYQFQYSGYVRFIDLDTISVIHQRLCHYPPQTTHMGQWLQPKEYPSLSMDIPTWENSMNVPELIEQLGEKIQIQIHKAVIHCLQEFQNLFPPSSSPSSLRFLKIADGPAPHDSREKM